MVFSVPALPYDHGALEPYIDSTTMQIHHDKHHTTYVNNLNAALEKYPELQDLGIVDLNKAVGSSKIPSDIATKVRNSGGGHLNHSFFWNIMGKSSDNNGPSSELKSAIDSAFGSLEEMKNRFNTAAAGQFGSGWAWLSVADGKLAISGTANQDNPLFSNASSSGIPVLGLDVWEHAYYLKYQNRRPEYISAFWNVVNWDQVNSHFQAAKGGSFSVEAKQA